MQEYCKQSNMMALDAAGIASASILTQASTTTLELRTPLRFNPIVAVPTCFSYGTQGPGPYFWRITPIRKAHVVSVQRNKQFDAVDNSFGHFNRLVMYSGEGDGDVPMDDPQEEDSSKSAGLLGTLHRIQAAARIFMVALFWISLFFAASAWDGINRGRPNKKDSQHKH